MFQIDPNPTFTAEADIPVAGGGTSKLKLVFKHKTKDEAREYFSRTSAGDEDDAAALLEIVQGWEDVDVAFSRDALGRLLQNYPGAPRAIFGTYLAELMGQRRGN